MATTRNPCRSTGTHGTYWAYSKHGCRCLRAVLEESVYRRRLRSGNPIELVREATGASRTARGLAAYGYTVAQIAAASGVSERVIAYLQAGKPTIRSSKDRALRAAAEKLLAAPPPTGYSASMARSAARRNGWPPLHAWDEDTLDDPTAQPNLGGDDSDVVDEIAARRALSGERVRLNEAERVIAVRLGLDRGMTITAVAKQLHISYERARALAPEDWTADTTTRAA